jgi:hypothetical protein
MSKVRRGPRPQANGEYLSASVLVPMTPTEKETLETLARTNNLPIAAMARVALREYLETAE